MVLQRLQKPYKYKYFCYLPLEIVFESCVALPLPFRWVLRMEEVNCVGLRECREHTHAHTNGLRITHALNYRNKENKQQLQKRKQSRIWESKSESVSGLTPWTCQHCLLVAFQNDVSLSSDLSCVQCANRFPRNCKDIKSGAISWG